MFDIGWMELLLIGIVALIVVGPKELPVLFRTAGRYMGKARAMARDFQRSMEQAADESGLNEAARGLKSVEKFNVRSPGQMARKYVKTVATVGDDADPDATGKGETAKPDPAPAAPAEAAPTAADRAPEPAPADADRTPK